MCIVHEHANLQKIPKKPFIAYKVIGKDNRSLYHYDFLWKVGVHKTPVQRLTFNRSYFSHTLTQSTGRGFYVYLDRDEAFEMIINKAFEMIINTTKVIAVHLCPKDVVYTSCDNIAVCRRLEIKSLRGLKRRWG